MTASCGGTTIICASLQAVFGTPPVLYQYIERGRHPGGFPVKQNICTRKHGEELGGNTCAGTVTFYKNQENLHQSRVKLWALMKGCHEGGTYRLSRRQHVPKLQVKLRAIWRGGLMKLHVQVSASGPG